MCTLSVLCLAQVHLVESLARLEGSARPGVGVAAQLAASFGAEAATSAHRVAVIAAATATTSVLSIVATSPAGVARGQGVLPANIVWLAL